MDDDDGGPFADAIRSMAARFEGEVALALDRTALLALTSLQSTRRFDDRTGNLRASFSSAPSSEGRIVSAGMPYAGFLEWGTRTITPRPFMNDARSIIADALPREMGDAWARTVNCRG